MTELSTIIIVLGASTLISAVYLSAGILRKSTQMVLSGLIMLLTPPVGVLYYAGQYIVRIIKRGDRRLQLDELTFSTERHARVARPDVEAETETVPLEELFLVASDADKRKRLLLELKKEKITNYIVIAKAFDNDDPETSHYAAAAVANAKANYENEIREYNRRYSRDETDMKLARGYANLLLEYLRSGILDAIEIKKYNYQYINLMSGPSISEDFFTVRDYTEIVNRSIAVGEYIIAQSWADKSFAAKESEAGYINLLKVYYYTNRPDEFFTVMQKLKESEIPLSEEGLALVRFFLKPRSIDGQIKDA